MFFDVENGIPFEKGKSERACWTADNFIHFDSPHGMMSIYMNDKLFIRFIDFLNKVSENDGYLDLKRGKNWFVAAEDTDEGRRNLCFANKDLYFVLNMPTKHIPAFAKYLISDWKS